MGAVDHPALSIPVGSRPALVMRAWRAVAKVWRAVNNRGEMRRLSDLTDWELADIGLTRDDLARAWRLPLSEDPTLALRYRARERAVQEAGARRVC